MPKRPHIGTLVISRLSSSLSHLSQKRRHVSKEDILEVDPPGHQIISTEVPDTVEQRKATPTVPLPDS